MIVVQRSQSCQSTTMSQCQFILSSPLEPSPDHDHDDIQEFWWDDHVTEFPAAYYALITPAEYEELFIDDDDASEEMTEEFIDVQDMSEEFIDVLEIPKKFAATCTTANYTFTTDEEADTMDEEDNATDADTYTTEVADRKSTIARMFHARRTYRAPRRYAATDHTYLAVHPLDSTSSRSVAEREIYTIGPEHYKIVRDVQNILHDYKREDVEEERQTTNSKFSCVKK